MQPHQFSDPRKNRIHYRLNALVGRGAAAFYRDACRLMEMEMPLESTTHLVGHLLRETMSSLLAVLVPLLEVTVEKKSKKNGYERKIIAALNKLEIPETSDVAKIWLYLANERSEYALNKLAHRNSLQPPRVISEEFTIFWEEIQMLLDGVLERFETVTAEIRIKLDSLMSKALPTDDDIDFLRQGIPNSSFALGYFFEKLEHPEWLQPLKENGFFNNPIDIETDAEGKTFRFPVWQQSRYLLRVVSHKPKEVLEIGIQIFDTDCKNILVYEDLAEAALKMPPEFAALWAERAAKWLKQQSPFIRYVRLLDILGRLIKYLIVESHVDTAINLARELLAVLPTDSEISPYENITVRMDEYYYSKIIKECILTVLIDVKHSYSILNMFSDLLNQYLQHRHPAYATSENLISEDYSNFWSRDTNTSWNEHGINNILARAVWETTKQILEMDSSQAKILCQKFQPYRWRIFDRMVLYVMLDFPEHLQDLIIERLSERNRIKYRPEEIPYCQEHSMLLQRQFANLPENSQNQIFQWLLEDPQDVQIDDVEKREIYIKYWRRDWLSVISNCLSPELNQIYLQLDQEISSITDTTNSNRPKSEEELVQLAKTDIKELLNYLKEFPQAQNHFSWASVITPYPQKFVDEIEYFKELDLRFMGWLLRGLEQALKENKSEQSVFSWEPVINFCAWILDGLKEIYNYSSSNEWSRLCDDVVSLIDAGLQAKGLNKIPLTLRSQIWKILEHLTNDQYVTPSFSIYYQESKQSPYGVSLNTVRGRAMHSVIRYVWWIRQDADGNVSAAIDFQNVSEVQQVLEQHLDPKQDPSLAIRSVYGAWITTIYHIASDWTVQHIDQIFPEEPDSKELFESAWEGYILNNHVYSDVFNILREKYKYVIKNLSDKHLTSREQSESNRSLSHHLLNLFRGEVLDLDEPDKLIEKFFANAPVDTRSEFIRDIGWRLLYGTREPHNIPITQELGQRFQKLLDWRISKSQEDKLPIEQVADLKYFSWWFASGKLDNQWAITKLIEVLSIVETVEYCEDFLEHLEYLASEMSQEAVQCLSLLANGSRAIEWFRLYRSSHFAAILRSAMESGDVVSQKKAKELINQLVARDLADYRELLLTPD